MASVLCILTYGMVIIFRMVNKWTDGTREQDLMSRSKARVALFGEGRLQS